MTNLGCKKVWTGDTGYGGTKSYVVNCPTTATNNVNAKTVSNTKESVAKPKETRENDSNKCDSYIGDSGFLGAIKSLLWLDCNSK